MLLPKEFDTDGELPSFIIQATSLHIGENDIGPVDIPTSYDANWRLLFCLTSALSLKHVTGVTFSNEKVAFCTTENAGKKHHLLVTRSRFDFQDGCNVVEARPKSTPLIFGGTNQPSYRLDAVLVNTPEFLKKPITLVDANSSEFLLIPKQAGKCLLTSTVQCSFDNPIAPLADFIEFITFVKGSRAGLGNLIAYDERENVAHRLLGFSPIDQIGRQTNWFDKEIQYNLPAIFSAFSTAMAELKTKTALHQTIAFYRAANVSRDTSIEMSIIAAHTALEAITNYTLEARAAWSGNLMKNRSIRFSDKLRVACQYFGLTGDLLQHSPKLAELSQSRNDEDAFSLISFVRNKLVHQDLNFQPTGILLHEIWLLAQWLVEILIFGVIGYRGKIIDRRIYQGWRGETCDIPLHHNIS